MLAKAPPLTAVQWLMVHLVLVPLREGTVMDLFVMVTFPCLFVLCKQNWYAQTRTKLCDANSCSVLSPWFRYQSHGSSVTGRNRRLCAYSVFGDYETVTLWVHGLQQSCKLIVAPGVLDLPLLQ